MANSEAQECIEWITAQQDSSDVNTKELGVAYNSLTDLSSKRTACLEVISQIAGLEDVVQAVSVEFDARAVHLVNASQSSKTSKKVDQSSESLARTSQNCMVAVRNNWRWIGQMLQCTQVHFRNAAEYHQFFHDVQEAEDWMRTTLSKVHLTFDRSKLHGDPADAQAMMEEIRNVLVAYLQWQSKVDSLFDRAKDIVPVPARLKPTEAPRPVTALTDNRTKQIDFFEGESLTLLDNSNPSKWQVKNDRGQTGTVPAVLLLISGPDPNAVDAAVKLRVQLLALWTASVKRLGYQMIAFMLLVIRDWNDEEFLHQLNADSMKAFENLPNSRRDELIGVLRYLEENLVEHWTGYREFDELQERILRLRMILEEYFTENTQETQFLLTVITQINTLKELLIKYKDFWAYWETYKVIVETLKQPKLILICDKWEQLRFVTTAHFVRFWDTHLDMEEAVKVDQYLAIHEKPRHPLDGSSDLSVSTVKEETETEQVTTTVQEEERTFYMRAVIDPRDEKTEISFQQAVLLGIIDQAAGKFINPITGDTMPIGQAITEGKVLIEWTSSRKLREEKKSYGIITIKTTNETRPYTIVELVNPLTRKLIPVAEAMELGILDTHNSLYVSESDGNIPLVEAIDLGLVKVNYHGSEKSQPSVVTKSYAVNSVVDQQKKDKIPFADAVRLGILEKSTGAYINNVTGERVPVREAIMKGFIKARVVDDPNQLDIDPENRIVIERISNVRDKLLRGIRAVKAMKAAHT